MKALALALLAVAACHSATIGLEDWRANESDFDYNDIQLATGGITFHTLEPWVFGNPPGYHETPFPMPAHYFDYGVADSTVGAWVTSMEGTPGDLAMLSINGGGWQLIPGYLILTTQPGDIIRFGLFQSWQGVVSSDPAQNWDGRSYAVVADGGGPGEAGAPPQQEAPEPASVALIGGGLLVMGLWRRRRG